MTDDNEKTILEFSGAVDPAEYMGGGEPMEPVVPSEIRDYVDAQVSGGPVTKAFMDLNKANAPEVRIQTLPHFPAMRKIALATPGSSGMDVFAAINSPKKLNIIGARALVPTGIRVQVPFGYEIQVRPKSGLANKFGVTVLNTPGTVDSDYRGEIGVIMILLSQGKFIIEPGMKIAQIVLAKVETPFANIIYVDDLDDSERGEGGFGSTGK